MRVGWLLTETESALRELCVYYSHDCDAARARGDNDSAHYLHGRWNATGALADELHALNPDVVAGDPWVVQELRDLARDLAHRLGVIAAHPEARRRGWRPPDGEYCAPWGQDDRATGTGHPLTA